MANLELPAFEYSGLALQLALELYLETLGRVWIGVAMVSRDRGVRTKVRLRVIAIGQTEDPMQQDLMPATEVAQHLWLGPFLQGGQRETKAGLEHLPPSEYVSPHYSFYGNYYSERKSQMSRLFLWKPCG